MKEPQQKSLNTNIWGFALRLLITTVSAILVAKLLPGVYFSSLGSVIVAALLLAVLNNLLRPALLMLALPLTVISISLTLLLINTVIVLLTAAITPGFSIDGFGSALLFSLLITILNYFLSIPDRMLRRSVFVERQSSDNEKFDDYEEVESDYEELSSDDKDADN